MSNAQRRSTSTEKFGKLLQKFPNYEKNLSLVHIVNADDGDYDMPMCTYPIMDGDTTNYTMYAYRLYVMAYNQKVALANKDILKQRKTSEKWVLQQSDERKANILLQQVGFENNNTMLSTVEYNQKATAFNEMQGNPIIAHKKIQQVKQSTEQVFRTILYEYGHQLFEYKKLRATTKNIYARPLPKMEINTKHLENTRDKQGIPFLSYCPDTILNHKNRLIEAGILINSRFHGSKRGTRHHISTKILAVYDDYHQNIVCTENQLFRISKPEVFRDAVIPTRTYNKTIVKRAVDNSTPLDKDKALQPLHNIHLADDFTRTPSGKMSNPKLEIGSQKNKLGKNSVSGTASSQTGMAAATEISRVDENTEFLTEKITSAQILAENLSANKNKKVKPLPLDRLKYEADSGTMSQVDFRTLLIQDLFNQFQKLYIDHPKFNVIFIGAWLRIYQVWMESNICINKNGDLLHKTTMLIHYRELLYCINNSAWGVYAWVKNKNFVPANPGVYLNPKNSTKGTFAHQYRKVREKAPKAFVAIRAIVAKASEDGKKAQKYSNNLRLLNKKFAAFFNGKINNETLLRYVRDNMPKEVRDNFDLHFNNFRNNKFK
tara:strand:- start:30407 stop:32215 length:1809 start_codon:yes stop_codon:yes gene_type:complete